MSKVFDKAVCEAILLDELVKMTGYADYIAVNFNKAQTRLDDEPRQLNLLFQDFCLWAGHAATDCDLLKRKAGAAELYKTMSETSAAFIIGHELGHIILGHLNRKSDASFLQQEQDADRFSFALMTRAGLNPGMARGVLTWISMINPDIASAKLNEKVHPPGPCRLLTGLYLGDQALVNGPSQVSGYSLGPLNTKDKEMFQDEMESIAKEIVKRPECPPLIK